MAAKPRVLFDLNIHLPYQDFEDAVKMMSALEVHADCVLTRNVRGYDPAPVDVVQPVELLAILNQRD